MRSALFMYGVLSPSYAYTELPVEAILLGARKSIYSGISSFPAHDFLLLYAD
jgi:hypothetical protein